MFMNWECKVRVIGNAKGYTHQAELWGDDGEFRYFIAKSVGNSDEQARDNLADEIKSGDYTAKSSKLAAIGRPEFAGV